MIITDLKIASNSLGATKLRTALTILGIIIGVASVTLVLSLGDGARQAVQAQTQLLGPTSLTIRSGKAIRDINGDILSYNFLAALGTPTISLLDLSDIQKIPHVSAAPLMSIVGGVSLASNQQGNEQTIIATQPDMLKVMDFHILSGSFVDETIQSNSVVLGYDIAQNLLGSAGAIGRTIYIRGQQFTVVGILAPYNIPPNFNNPFDFNQSLFISLPEGEAFNQGVPQIQQINARVDSVSNLKGAVAQIRHQLLINHSGEEDFTILQPADTIKTVDSLLHLLTILTTAVASISLIVGGIGIMNIMLVSVTERTREIGIRKTVGATNAQILRQFMIESLLMSLIGGMIGVLLAYTIGYIISLFINFTPVVTVPTIAIACGMSLIIGLVFGLAPAIKAARKNPIEALRFYQ